MREERCELPASAVHLVGIGGVGMAGLARLLHQQGLRVSGSDRSGNRLTAALQESGVRVFTGHAREHVPESVAWGIRTPAIPASNPEVERLRSRNLPVFARGDVLAKLTRTRPTFAVAGAHGKTTTSAMLLHVLRNCGVQAGYAIGGETAFPGRVADWGDPEAPWVVEADESDGTLSGYHPETGVITHLEWDHVERFPSEKALCACYERFARQAGTLWIREEDALAAAVCDGHPRLRKVGRGTQAELQMREVSSAPEGLNFRFQRKGTLHEVYLPLPGEHNAWNALMAIGVACEAGVDPAAAAECLASYAGVGRRFQRKTIHGVTIIQDYAHHPTELRAVMNSVKALQPKRIWMVFQPHRFSRTRHLLREFASALTRADELALLPVYAAFEQPEQGADSESLAELCRASHPDVQVWEDRDALVTSWSDQVRAGDVVLLAGAGDIETLWGSFVTDQIKDTSEESVDG